MEIVGSASVEDCPALLLRSSRRIRQAFILRREIRAVVASGVHEPLDARPALGVASFRAGWRDELAATDWFFILPAVDLAAYERGRERAKVFRKAIAIEGKRRSDWSGLSSLSALR